MKGDTLNQVITTKEAFQSFIRGELRKSGIVNTITSELRGQIFHAFNESNYASKLFSKKGYNLEQAAIRSLVLEYLTCDGLEQTASVLASESCLDENILSWKEALKVYTVPPNSPLYSKLTRVKDLLEERREIGCFKDTTIHVLLSHASQSLATTIETKISVSTQTVTIDGNLKAREELDRRLELIGEKYEQSSNYYSCNVDDLIDSKLLSIQKECEECARKEMEHELKRFQNTEIISMRKEEEDRRQRDLIALRSEMKQEYEIKIQELIKRQEEMKASFEAKEREIDYNKMKAQQSIMNHEDKLRQREIYLKNEIDLERKKLQIEEQRIKQILANAEAKFDLAEKKEKALRDGIKAEYDRVRCEAKKSFEDASETARKQSDFYSKELKELNALRSAVSLNLAKNNEAEVELLKVRAEREDLRKELENSMKKLNEFRILLEDRDLKATANTIRGKEIELNLQEVKKELTNHKKAGLIQEKEFAKQKAELEKDLQEMQEKLQVANLEKSTLTAELEDIKRLFQKSQEALLTCKAKATEDQNFVRLKGNSPIGREINNKFKLNAVAQSQIALQGLKNNRTMTLSPKSESVNSKDKVLQKVHINHINMEEKYNKDNVNQKGKKLEGNTNDNYSLDQTSDSRKSFFDVDRRDNMKDLSLISDVTMPMIQQEKEVKGSPSVHSIATIMSLDLSKNNATESKLQSSTAVHKEDKFNQDDSKDKEMVKGSNNTMLMNCLTEEDDCRKKVSLHDYDKSRSKEERDETTNVYDLSEFEHESINGEDKDARCSDEASAQENNAPKMHLSIDRDMPAFDGLDRGHELLSTPTRDYKDKRERKKSSGTDSNETVGEYSKKSILSTSRESFKSSSQYESSSSAGIEVFSYKQSDKQTDWW